METLKTFIGEINSVVWGPPMLVLILGVGILFTFLLSAIQIRKLGYSLRLLWQGRSSTGVGDITAFRALMTSMSATVGTGNLAGVATAIAIGGPGALFWMWMTALFGMATKYAESACAVKFREKDADGKQIGGPMYYIKNGLGKRWSWLGWLYAFFGAAAAFGIGNMVQSNTMADALDDSFGISPYLTGSVIVILVSAVLIGGIKNIAAWASKLVPFMAVLYVVLGVIVLAVNALEIPAALQLIVSSAFSRTAATGGFAGATILLAIQYGVARGIFSNEAGLGSGSIAHAAAKTDNPVKQGSIAMVGTFVDTLIVCSITGLAIVSTGVWSSGETGIDLTKMAFVDIPGGEYFVLLILVIFAFTTILGWSYYGEKCWQYIFGLKSVIFYRLAWVGAAFIGAWALVWDEGSTKSIELIWLISDTLNAMMALPNLIALILLSPVVIALTREYYRGKTLQKS